MAMPVSNGNSGPATADSNNNGADNDNDDSIHHSIHSKQEQLPRQSQRRSNNSSSSRRRSYPLTFRNVFCGREEEILQMEGIFRRTAAARPTDTKYPSLVLIGGASGAGKSSLVNKLKEHLGTTEEEFFWISGKFEEQQQQQAVADTVVNGNGDGTDVAGVTGSPPSSSRRGSGVNKDGVGRSSSTKSENGGPDNLHPFAAIVDAFSEFCQELEEEEPETMEEVRADILDAVGQQGALLTYMIPSLTKIIGPQREAGREAQQSELRRFHFVFRNFMQALASQHRNVVLVLEDLHRADEPSLELLHSLFTSQLRHVMFIGTYRSNEVDDEHRFTRWINGIRVAQAQGQVPEQSTSLNNANNKTNNNNPNNNNPPNATVTRLWLSEMALETVNSFIAKVLNDLTPDDTRSLAHIVYTKTNGNIFFVTQYMLFLAKKRLLWFDPVQKRWDWDEPAIREESAVTTTLLDFMKEKMSQSDVAPKILPVAACLGAKFNRETLRIILVGLSKVTALNEYLATPTTDDEVVELLKACEKDRFIENCGNKIYAFLHDKMQESALVVHPIIIMQQIRYEAGTVLFRQLDAAELDDRLFLVVNLLNAGYMRNDSVAPIEVAMLNLTASEKAKRLAAFSTAAKFIENAFVFLPPHSPDGTLRDTLLEVCSLGAEVNGALGRVGMMEKYCNLVLKGNEYTVFEQLRVQNVLLDSVANRGGHIHMALDRCINVLEQMGCTMPRSGIGQGIRAVTSLLQSKTSRNIPKADFVDSIPQMTDLAKLESLKLLDRAATYSYLDNNQMLFINCTTKMVRWTIKFGICDKSPAAFAMLGTVLMHCIGEHKAGQQYAEIALSMMRKLSKMASQDESQRAALTHSVSRTTFLAYGFVLYWTKSVQDYQDELVAGYEAGMRAGDIESAGYCGFHHTAVLFTAGKPLKTVEALCRRAIAEAKALNRGELEVFTRQPWQGILNLMGYSAAEGTTDLSGSAMDECDALERKGAWSTKLVPHNYGHMKVLLCAFFGDYEKGAKIAIEHGDMLIVESPGNVWGQSNPFMRGVCLYGAAINTKKRLYRKHGEKVRSLIRTWVKKGNPNAVHYLKLLDAEHEVCVGKPETAKTLYELACSSAYEEGFVQDAALANERFALFLLSSSSEADQEEGMVYLVKSMGLYEEWGAKAKVDMMLRKYPDLILARKPATRHKSKTKASMSLSISDAGPTAPIMDAISESPHHSNRLSTSMHG